MGQEKPEQGFDPARLEEWLKEAENVEKPQPAASKPSAVVYDDLGPNASNPALEGGRQDHFERVASTRPDWILFRADDESSPPDILDVADSVPQALLDTPPVHPVRSTGPEGLGIPALPIYGVPRDETGLAQLFDMVFEHPQQAREHVENFIGERGLLEAVRKIVREPGTFGKVKEGSAQHLWRLRSLLLETRLAASGVYDHLEMASAGAMTIEELKVFLRKEGKELSEAFHALAVSHQREAMQIRLAARQLQSKTAWHHQKMIAKQLEGVVATNMTKPVALSLLSPDEKSVRKLLAALPEPVALQVEVLRKNYMKTLQRNGGLLLDFDRQYLKEAQAKREHYADVLERIRALGPRGIERLSHMKDVPTKVAAARASLVTQSMQIAGLVTRKLIRYLQENSLYR